MSISQLCYNTCVLLTRMESFHTQFQNKESILSLHSGLFKITENILTVIYGVNEEDEIVEILDTGTYSTILKCIWAPLN